MTGITAQGPTLATTPRTGRLFYVGVAMVVIVLAVVAFTPSIAYQGGTPWRTRHW